MDQTVSRIKFETEVRSLATDVNGYATAKGWKLVSAIYPTLAIVLPHARSGRAIEFRFLCNDWDKLPPSLTLHSLEDRSDLHWADWPKTNWAVLDKHPTTGMPFVCLPGIREYHTHPSHLSDKWEGYRLRGTYLLRHIIDRVHQRFNDSEG